MSKNLKKKMKEESKKTKKTDKKILNKFLIQVVEVQKTLIYERTSRRKNKEMLEHIDKTLEKYLK